MKTTGLSEMLGKTITGVIVKQATRDTWPRSQLFLVFADDSYLEIFGDINVAGGLDPGGVNKARQYMTDVNRITFEAHL